MQKTLQTQRVLLSLSPEDSSLQHGVSSGGAVLAVLRHLAQHPQRLLHHLQARALEQAHQGAHGPVLRKGEGKKQGKEKASGGTDATAGVFSLFPRLRT